MLQGGSTWVAGPLYRPCTGEGAAGIGRGSHVSTSHPECHRAGPLLPSALKKPLTRTKLKNKHPNKQQQRFCYAICDPFACWLKTSDNQSFYLFKVCSWMTLEVRLHENRRGHQGAGMISTPTTSSCTSRHNKIFVLSINKAWNVCLYEYPWTNINISFIKHK